MGGAGGSGTGDEGGLGLGDGSDDVGGGLLGVVTCSLRNSDEHLAL